jgi:REP element-mobilizing transposase RayT
MDKNSIIHEHPMHGVFEFPDRTTVVYLTICTSDHQSWLANEEMQALLRELWLDARAWLVGYYLLMPDHMHFFATPGEFDFPLTRWTHYWKRNFTRRLPAGHPRLQDDQWDTRMRNGKHFTETWEYVRQNPVRKHLVKHPDDWPYQGVAHDWTYIGP